MELTIQANNDKINMRLDNEVSGIMTWGNGNFENNNIRISNVEGDMTRAREDLTRELANLNIMIAKAITLGESLRDAQYKLASEAELRALEDSVRTAGDSLRQMGYDMKELARQMNGGY